MFDQVDKVSENKTFGLFYLLLLDFYCFSSNSLKVTFEMLCNKEIIDFYFGLLGKNLVLNCYFLKGFFLRPELVEMLTD